MRLTINEKIISIYLFFVVSIDLFIYYYCALLNAYLRVFLHPGSYFVLLNPGCPDEGQVLRIASS